LEGSASLRRGGGKLAIQLAEEVLAAMAKEGACEEYLRRVERDAKAARQAFAAHTMGELTPKQATPRWRRHGGASADDATVAQVQVAAVAKEELTWPEAKALVHGNGVAARVQAAAVAKDELTWPEAKALVHGNGATARVQGVAVAKVLGGIVVELEPREPIFERCSHLREKRGGADTF
jgi:hypothetical protein